MEAIKEGVSLMDEKDLLNKIKGGDTESFDLLITEHLPLVRNILVSKYKIQKFDLDDILQIAAQKAWSKIHSFRGDCKFLTWFYTIVHNETCKHLKIRGKIDKHEITASPPFDSEEPTDYSHIFSDALDKELKNSAFDILERREMLKVYREVLEDTLNKLRPTYRTILKMAVEDEMSYKQIAELLGVPIGTVMSRLFLARQQAKKLIRNSARAQEVCFS